MLVRDWHTDRNESWWVAKACQSAELQLILKLLSWQFLGQCWQLVQNSYPGRQADTETWILPQKFDLAIRGPWWPIFPSSTTSFLHVRTWMEFVYKIQNFHSSCFILLVGRHGFETLLKTRCCSHCQILEDAVMATSNEAEWTSNRKPSDRWWVSGDKLNLKICIMHCPCKLQLQGILNCL